MEKLHYYQRQFLNREGHYGLAAFMASIEEPDEYGLYATVNVSDCNRNITLDFNGGNQEEFDNNVEKLDKLISSLQEFRRSYKKATRKALRLVAKRKAKKVG